MPTVNQLVRKGRKRQRRKPKSPFLDSNPQKRGVYCALLCCVCLLAPGGALSAEPASTGKRVFCADNLELMDFTMKLAAVYNRNVFLLLRVGGEELESGINVTIGKSALGLDDVTKQLLEQFPGYRCVVVPALLTLIPKKLEHPVLDMRVTISLEKASAEDAVAHLNGLIAEKGLPAMSLRNPTQYPKDLSYKAENVRVMDVLQAITTSGTYEHPVRCLVTTSTRGNAVYLGFERVTKRVRLSFAPIHELRYALTHGRADEKNEAVIAILLRFVHRNPPPFKDVKQVLLSLLAEPAGIANQNVYGVLGCYDNPTVRRKMLQILRESDNPGDRVNALYVISRSKMPDRARIVAEACLKKGESDVVVVEGLRGLSWIPGSRWREVTEKLRARSCSSPRIREAIRFCEQTGVKKAEREDEEVAQ